MRSSLTFEEWRDRARPLLLAGLEPVAACAAIADGSARASPAAPSLTVPPELMRLLDGVSCFRSAGRYELMYRLAWRTLFENRRLLEDAADPDVRNARLMDAAVRREVHKMHAFVRFREVAGEDGEAAYFAWFEPDHDILRRGSRFFVERFPNMTWTIATPRGAAVWDKASLTLVETPGRNSLPARDEYEDLWRTYYRHICNVARINPTAMQREMPKKFWKGLPESAEIDGLLRRGGRAQDIPASADERTNCLTQGVKRALAGLPSPGDGPETCRRCGLWQHATQAVPGAGPRRARLMLVGEQPGDEEDLRGEPFVGPAGRVLDQAIAAAGLERSEVYVTNAVKHFKWEPRGKRRLHKKPGAGEIEACNIWLEGEVAGIEPRVIVALGATALRALTGTPQSVDSARRQTLSHAGGARIVVTYHPSAILRADGAHAEGLRGHLVADLERARALAEQPAR